MKPKVYYFSAIIVAALVLVGCKGKNNVPQNQANQPETPAGSSSLNNSLPSGSGTGQGNSGTRQVLNIPIYPDSSLKSYTKEGDSQESAGYTTPIGVSAKDVFAYYAQEMPALGWTKIQQDADKSVTYKNSAGRRAEIWIFYDNSQEGTDYIIESPPFTGHPAPVN